MFEVIFYKKEDGSVPVEEFLDSLDVKMRNKATDSLAILEEFGNKLREPYSKPIGDGIFELRIKFGSDISRIFYFFFVGSKIVLTNGYVKKTRKAPKQEILTAKEYKTDYERRFGHE